MNSILKMALFSVLNSDHFKQAKQSGDSGVKHNCTDTTHFLTCFPELYNTVSNVQYIISNSIQLLNCRIYVNQTPKIYCFLPRQQTLYSDLKLRLLSFYKSYLTNTHLNSIWLLAKGCIKVEYLAWALYSMFSKKRSVLSKISSC